MDDSRKDHYPGALEMMNHQTLRRQPLHGYGLVQHIQRVSRDLLRVEEGSLYPALQRLLRAGCVEARWELSEKGRRVRRYELTAEGARRLDREVFSFERMLEGIRLVLSPGEETP
jgi:transcriptional regulator